MRFRLLMAIFSSLILPHPREVTFGKIWIGLTFVMFVPLVLATTQLTLDLVMSILG